MLKQKMKLKCCRPHPDLTAKFEARVKAIQVAEMKATGCIYTREDKVLIQLMDMWVSDKIKLGGK